MKALPFLLLSSLLTFPLIAGEIVLREVRPRDYIQRGTWWSIYQDDTLDSLMKEASRANQNVKIAVFRFDQARAQARMARSQFFPEANLTATATRQTTSGNITVPFNANGLVITGSNFDVPLDVSYEIDLWGRVRKSFESAVQDAASASANIQGVLLSVQAELAQNYFGLRAMDAEIASLKTSLGYLTESQKIALAKDQSGTGTAIEVARSSAELAISQAELAGLLTQRDQLENAIALLIGKKPQQFALKATNTLPALPQLPDEIPSDLLERRPDVAASERALAANISRVGVAKLAGYPSLRLTASGGVVSGNLSSLLDAGSEKWSIGPSLSVPLFSGGKNKANLEAAKAIADISLAQYRQTILVAFGEVENQLSATTHLKDQVKYQTIAHTQAEKARDLAKQRYESGVGAYLESLDANRSAISSLRRMHQLRGQQLIASVTLIKSLGGGWNQKMPTVIPAIQVDPQAQTQAQPAEKKKNFFQRLFRKK